MKAVILAAGRGVRMGHLTKDTPKPMLRVNGRPILEYTFNSLPEEISEVIIVIGYKGEIIKFHFGDVYANKKIKYVVQNALNGSAGALYCAKNFLKEKFLVLNGDDLYYRPDLEKFVKNEPPAMLAKESDEPKRYGVIKVDGDGNFSEIIENPEEDFGNLVNIGAYLLDKKFFDYKMVKKSLKVEEKEFGLPQTLLQMKKDYKIKVIMAQFWQPVGYPEDIVKAEKIIGQFINVHK